MSKHIETLINQLILAAKARGISQAELAKMAGLSAVGLSKAKNRGDIRASTLAKLAELLEQELVLSPRQSQQKAVDAIRSGSFFNTSGAAGTKAE